MKKRIVKGILATTLALVSVFGVPQCKNLNAKLDTSITAEASQQTCKHDCSRFETYSDWSLLWYKDYSDYQWDNKRKEYYRCATKVEIKIKYVKCVKCWKIMSSSDQTRETHHVKVYSNDY